MEEPLRTAELPPSASSVQLERIVLTGFMGSGKTTLGKLLATRLGWPFLDLDHEVVRRTGHTVAQTFAERGEAAFRREESAALAEVIERSPLVLALGGGAPEAAANRELLRATANTATLFLSAPFSVLQSRCTAQDERSGAALRPLLAQPVLARERFHRREPLYREIAAHKVDAGTKPVEQLVEEILLTLGGGLPPQR